MSPKAENIVKNLRDCVFDIGPVCDKCAVTGEKIFNCRSELMLIAADLIEQLQQELIDERCRHDRLQDFCVAQGEELSALKADMETATRVNFCDVCAHLQPDKNEHCARCSYENSEFKWRDIQVPEPPKEDTDA